MAQIKTANIFEIKNLKRMNILFEDDNIYKNSDITCFFNYLLKKKKYFVISNQNTPLAFICLSKHSKHSQRHTITKIASLDKTNFELLKKLINSSISKASDSGSCSFFANVSYQNDEILNLLIKNCHFRFLSSFILFEIKRHSEKDSDKFSNKFEIKTFESVNKSKLLTIYNDSILPQFKPYFSKHEKEFFQKTSKTALFFEVISKESKRHIGVFSLKSNDLETFILEIGVNSDVENIIEEILDFCLDFVSTKQNSRLIVKNNKFQTFNIVLEKQLSERECKIVENKAILVKDLLTTIKVNKQYFNFGCFFNEIKRKPAFFVKSK